MKICFISLKSYPYFNNLIKKTYGGTVTHFANLAQGLKRYEKLNIFFITADYGQTKVEQFDGVTLIKTVDYRRSKLVKIFQLLKGICLLKPGIIIVSSLRPYFFLVGVLSKLMGMRFVYMVASDIEADLSHPMFCSSSGKIIGKGIMKLSDCLIVQNEYQRENAEEKIGHRNLHLMKKGILVNQELRLVSKEFDGIWIGRCVKCKNPEIFLQLAAKFSSKKFIMICAETSEESGYFREIKQQAVKIPNLQFNNYTPHSEVLEKLSKSRIFCFTSKVEGDWPMTVLEAASLGIPVISLFLNYKFLIDDFGGGVFCYGSMSIMEQKILEIAESDEQRSHMGNGAIEYIDQHHNNDIIAEEFYQILKKIFVKGRL